MTAETATEEVDPRVRLAEAQEQAAADQALAAHLRSRVVALRIDLNAAVDKLQELAAELEARPPRRQPQDRRSPAKKTAPKKGRGGNPSA